MAGFTMCPACHAEYEYPSNRRFYVSLPVAPSAGRGNLQLLDGSGQPVATSDPLAMFAECLRTEKIGALEGPGWVSPCL